MNGLTPEADGWNISGEKITAPEKLNAIRSVIHERGPIILEHKFYRGGKGPNYLLFEEYAEFEVYLNTKPRAGDRITVWMLCDVCRKDTALATGKCPDDKGRVPERGAY
jgi:hypothetical protein